MTTSLPWRGLGLSSNLNARDEPNPYRLLDASPGLFDFVEYSAPLLLDEARVQASLFPEMFERRAEVPVLFHPVHLNLYGPSLEDARSLQALSAHAVAVGSAWVGNDVGWWHAGGQPFPGYLYLPPPLTQAGLADCMAHALHVQAALDVPLLLENPAVIARRGTLHVLDFMAGLHARTGLGLLLDLGHLLSHQLSAGLAVTDGLDGFPLEQVIEIHLAGGVVTSRGGRRFYADDHTLPVREELFELLGAVLPRCKRLRAVTFEGDGHPATVAAATLRRLRGLVSRESPGEVTASKPVGRPPGAAALATRPWELFEEVHAGRAGEDVEGLRAEVDLRLAVVGQALDLAWPVTRLLVARTREGLAEFTASPEFRGLFEEGAAGLEQAFGAYARRTVREEKDDAAAAALAFETWARSAHAHPPQEVIVKPFPFDLSELLFAARTLRRHLSLRAWGCGMLEPSGLESLRQVALRPQPGPWPVAIRQSGGRLEILPLAEAVALGWVKDGEAR